MPCSVLENDETVKGWKAGNSVAYCEPCFREVTEEHQKVEWNNSNESGKKEIYRGKTTQTFLFLRTWKQIFCQEQYKEAMERLRMMRKID